MQRHTPDDVAPQGRGSRFAGLRRTDVPDGSPDGVRPLSGGVSVHGAGGEVELPTVSVFLNRLSAMQGKTDSLEIAGFILSDGSMVAIDRVASDNTHLDVLDAVLASMGSDIDVDTEYANIFGHYGMVRVNTRDCFEIFSKITTAQLESMFGYPHTRPLLIELHDKQRSWYSEYAADQIDQAESDIAAFFAGRTPKKQIGASVNSVTTADAYNVLQPNTRRDKEFMAKPDLSVPPYDRRRDEGCFAVLWLTSDGVIFSSRCRDFGQALRMSRQHKRDPLWVIAGLSRELDTAQLCLSYSGQDWLSASTMDTQVRRVIRVVATQNLPAPSNFIQPARARSPVKRLS